MCIALTCLPRFWRIRLATYVTWRATYVVCKHACCLLLCREWRKPWFKPEREDEPSGREKAMSTHSYVMEQHNIHRIRRQQGQASEEIAPVQTWLALQDGPSWEGHEIKHNDDANTVVIDSTLILCRSKVEYQTLMRLLAQPKECVPFDDLMPSFDYARDREALGKRVGRLRRKLPPTLTIRCELGEGYVLRETHIQDNEKPFPGRARWGT